MTGERKGNQVASGVFWAFFDCLAFCLLASQLSFFQCSRQTPDDSIHVLTVDFEVKKEKIK